ncbi:hypothetical protein PMAYCL1PPCAC_12041, partial [Pristionchus mayeri]
QTPEEISGLHCETSKSFPKGHWKFRLNGIEETAEPGDNFVCAQYKTYSEEKAATDPKADFLENTSPQCSPVKIDSICYINQERCLSVTKTTVADVTLWGCEEGRRLWYFRPDAKEMEEGMEMDYLNCTEKDPFWRAMKINGSAAFIPQPHSNFLCFSSDTTKEDKSASSASTQSGNEGKGSDKKWEWPIDVFESILLFTSLLIFVFSVVIVVWANAKRRQEKKIEEQKAKLK